jgi:hypothetical protein
MEADRARGVCAVDYCWCPWCVVLRSVGVLVGSQFSSRDTMLGGGVATSCSLAVLNALRGRTVLENCHVAAESV